MKLCITCKETNDVFTLDTSSYNNPELVEDALHCLFTNLEEVDKKETGTKDEYVKLIHQLTNVLNSISEDKLSISLSDLG